MNGHPGAAGTATPTGSTNHRLLRAVVLDWAGTTLDHGSLAPVGAFVEVFRRFGVTITIAQARAPMGMFKLDHIRAIAAEPSVARQWQKVQGKAWTDADATDLFEDLVPIQAAVLPNFCKLIAGTVAATEEIRARGYRIGSTTGYPRSVGEIAACEAKRQGYEPDAMVCADEVPAGRPEPWMLLRVMEQLRVFPPRSVVKVGDTKVDVDEGINAGTWAVGVTRTGNGMGLTEEELAGLPARERASRIRGAADALRGRGAHYVIESIAELPPVLDDIEIRLALGERP